MEWVLLEGFLVCSGHEHMYLIETGETEVRLTRWTNGATRHQVAAEAARNVIVFPLGRGPGRPGGLPELAALVESAKTFAGQYEAGGDFENYPAWRHDRARFAVVDADLARRAERARFLATGDANDCPNC